MSEPGNPRDPLGKPVVMEEIDYRIAARSHLWRVVFALLVGCGGGFLTRLDEVQFGVVPCVLIGIGFGYGIGGKFFPDSDRYFWYAARNYRRVRRGREPLGVEQSQAITTLDEFRRG